MPVLVDATFNGAPRKLLLQASRNGYFFVLDRTNGKNLLTRPSPRPTGPRASARRDALFLIPPRSHRATAGSWRRMKAAAPTTARRALDPATGLLIVSAHDALRHLLLQARTRRLRVGGCRLLGLRQGLRCAPSITGPDRSSGSMICMAAPGTAGVLTTANGALHRRFRPTARWRCAPAMARHSWHSGIGRVGNGPITYELDGRQYVLFGGGNGLYAFALPVKR